jgi:WD40 repeat protein
VSTLSSPVPLPGRPEVIALSPHGRMLAVGVARTTSIPVTSGATNNRVPVVVVWDVDHRRFVLSAARRMAPGIGSGVSDVAVDDKGVVAWSGGRPGLAEVDMWNGRERSGGPVEDFPCDIVMNGDGSLLASIGSTGRINEFATRVSIWRIGPAGLSKKATAVFSGRPGFAPGASQCAPQRSSQFDPADPNVIAIGGWDGTVRLWDATTGRIVGRPLRAKRGTVSEVSFSPDVTRLLARDDGGLKIWTLRPRSVTKNFVSAAASDRGIWFGPDAHVLVTVGSAGTIATNAERASVSWLGSPVVVRSKVTDAAFDPKASVVALCEPDGNIDFYDTHARALRGPPLASGVASPHVVYSTDGRRLLVWGESGGGILGRVWDADSHRRLGPDIHDRSSALSRWLSFLPATHDVVGIHADISDARVVALAPHSATVDLRGSPDTDAFQFAFRAHAIPLATLWGAGVWDVRTGRRISSGFPTGCGGADGRRCHPRDG